MSNKLEHSIYESKKFKETLDELAKITLTRLKDFFNEIVENPPSRFFETETNNIVLSQVKNLTIRGGKRLRAALLMSGANLFDKRAGSYPCVIDAAASMELFQTYLLIHDDIMDDDSIRRGGPTVHTALAGYTGNKHLGMGLGILAGDLASALHQILLSKMNIDGSRQKKVLSIFSSMHLDVIYGQSLDMTENVPAFKVATHKTASYTTIGPLTIGATLAGSEKEDIAHLAKIALPLGIAFQFRDDILGTFGSSKTTGKPNNSDLREGKRTVLLEEGRVRADSIQIKLIENVVGKKDASDEEINEARIALEKCGAKEACHQHIKELTLEFVEGIDSNHYTNDAKDFLFHAAKFIMERDA